MEEREKWASILMATSGGQISLDCLKNSNQDPVEWFKAFEKYAASWNWDLSIMARKVPVYLKGEADSYWNQLTQQERSDYEFVKNSSPITQCRIATATEAKQKTSITRIN
jgi:hypothetical protein